MNKKELKEKIKAILISQFGKSLDSNRISLDSPAEDEILTKFPELKKVIVDLLTQQYDLFIKEIQWVAPRPTTFKIVLANDQYFYLIYNGRSWTAQVEGKKYYLRNIKEEENAANALSRILKQGQELPTEKSKETDQEEEEPQEPPQ